MNLDDWRLAVTDHISSLDQLVNDRAILKDELEKHLSQFFEWDNIEHNRDFTVITLSWEKDVNPVIKSDKISELGMDWIIKTGRDDSAFSIVMVEIYPWGVEET